MHRAFHIAASVLLLMAYVLSFSLTPAAHAHSTHEQAATHHVHLQSADPVSEPTHSSSCIYCVRIQSSAVVLTRVLPAGILLPQREHISVSKCSSHSTEQFAHCPGRAPPSPLS